MTSKSPLSPRQIIQEQDHCLALQRQGLSREDIAIALGISVHAVKRRLRGALKAERLDPEIRNKLASRGVTDLAGLSSGWIIEREPGGSGHSLHFSLGPDEEKIDFAEAVRESLSLVPKAPLIRKPRKVASAEDMATWMFLADLHVGGDYGAAYLEEDFRYHIDDVISRLPPAEKAVFVELGDLLDANDHKGVTPASGNNCDVIRDNHLGNTRQAIRLMKWAIDRLAETHEEVEVHLIPGNHDPTAYIAVLVSLEQHYANNARIDVIVPERPEEEEYRVIQWGTSSCFPHHGDKAKWSQLKDVWTDQFAVEWAESKMFRLIATAHYHHEKVQDLVGATARQFRTIHRPNKWARSLGLFSRGSISALSVHKERGYRNETTSQVTPVFLGKEI